MASYEQDFAESLQHYETSAETAEWCRCSHQTCLLCFKLSIRQQEMKVNLDAHAELACLFAQLGYIISCFSHQICILLNSIKLYLGPSYIGQPLTQQWSHVPIVPILWHTFDITCGADVTTRFPSLSIYTHALCTTLHCTEQLCPIVSLICTYTSGFHMGRDIGSLPPSQSSTPLVLTEFH